MYNMIPDIYMYGSLMVYLVFYQVNTLTVTINNNRIQPKSDFTHQNFESNFLLNVFVKTMCSTFVVD